MGKVLGTGIFVLTVLVVLVFIFYFAFIGDTKGVQTAGRDLYTSDFNYTVNYPVRWEKLTEKGVEGEYLGSIEIMFRPIDSTGVLFYMKYPYESGGLGAFETMERFEKQAYINDQLFIATSTNEIFHGERDAYDIMYKTGIGDYEKRHRKIIIVEDALVYEMNFVVPADEYRLFEVDADYMFRSFKFDWE